MQATSALHRLGGVSDRRSLLTLVSRPELERGLSTGEVVKAARNLYALPAADEAALAARRAHGVVSHLSAALAWGWKVKTVPARPTVTVARNRHPAADARVDMRYSVLTPKDAVDGRTSPVRTALDCARTLPFDEALAVVDSALRSRKMSRADLVAAADAGPRTGRARALRVITVASKDAANPFESVLRAIALGVPGLDVVAQGAVGRWHADVADLGLRIAIEAESFEFHALPEAFRFDIRRYTEMIRMGWLVARFVYEDVMERPSYVREVLADLVVVRHQEAVRGAAG
jgi:very-short-patch-repair endonuclease